MYFREPLIKFGRADSESEFFALVPTLLRGNAYRTTMWLGVTQ